MSGHGTSQGPGKSILGIGQRIITLLIDMAETRLKLVVFELEEEKSRLFRLLLLTGLTLIFTVFGLMCLLVLLVLAVEPAYRLQAMAAATAILLILALICGICTLVQSRRSTLLHHTRRELQNDRALLDDKK